VTTLDPQALEMAIYPMDEWLRWEREHHATPDAHAVPVEDCPLCRWGGCQAADCDCRKGETDGRAGR
jgi:hypothetical protein